MSYKPDESALIAYLYGELSESEREKVERYLIETPEARMELQKMESVKEMLGEVKDKEVIAPVFINDRPGDRFFFNSTYFKSLMAIAASLLVLVLAARLVDLEVSYSDNELRIGFGPEEQAVEANVAPQPANLTALQVQEMIDASLSRNSTTVETNIQRTQEQLSASIRKSLAANSDRVDLLVREASLASQEQIGSYVTTLQAQNMQMVKDYFQMTSTEQKQYIEDLLVDFAKYLQQQRNDDLQLLQTRLNDIQQNTDQFKLETEQILTSIITNSNLNTNTTKN